MNIQQSLNQILYTGTVAAGLYAHSPAGKLRAEKVQVNRDIARYNKRENRLMEIKNPEIFETAMLEHYKYGEKLAQKKFELTPTQENLKKLELEIDARRDWEDFMLEQQQERQETLKNQQEQFDLRKKLVEGTAEDPNVVPMKKTKVEVNTDGKE